MANQNSMGVLVDIVRFKSSIHNEYWWGELMDDEFPEGDELEDMHFNTHGKSMEDCVLCQMGQQLAVVEMNGGARILAHESELKKPEDVIIQEMPDNSIFFDLPDMDEWE